MIWKWQSGSFNSTDAMEFRVSPLPQALQELRGAPWGILCRVHLAHLKAAWMSTTSTLGPLLPLQRPGPV